jgi:hypothetical protein
LGAATGTGGSPRPFLAGVWMPVRIPSFCSPATRRRRTPDQTPTQRSDWHDHIDGPDLAGAFRPRVMKSSRAREPGTGATRSPSGDHQNAQQHPSANRGDNPLRPRPESPALPHYRTSSTAVRVSRPQPRADRRCQEAPAARRRDHRTYLSNRCTGPTHDGNDAGRSRLLGRCHRAGVRGMWGVAMSGVVGGWSCQPTSARCRAFDNCDGPTRNTSAGHCGGVVVSPTVGWHGLRTQRVRGRTGSGPR